MPMAPPTGSYFNPRTPVGCDHHSGTPRRTTRGFQSTHPSGVRRDTGEFLGHLGEISIHAPQWGATVASAPPLLTTLFQSTHPSGVRPACAPRSRSASRISIHAPQWGATDDRSDSVDDTLFQSTHPSGVRHTDPFKGWYDTEFQSTHPSGVRLSFPPTSTLSSSISIHAPQWGATFLPSYINSFKQYFNPRTPVGCDG